MESRVRFKLPIYSLVNLAPRRVIVKPMANGERYIVLFTSQEYAEAWRSRECPHADLWTISTRDNLLRFLKGVMSDRTCRVCIDPKDADGGNRPTFSIRDLRDRLKQRKTRRKRTTR